MVWVQRVSEPGNENGVKFLAKQKLGVERRRRFAVDEFSKIGLAVLAYFCSSVD